MCFDGQVCMAAAREDPCELLELYDSAPRMAPYLLDRLLERLRARLAAALSAFSPSVPLTFVACALGFDTARQVALSNIMLAMLQVSCMEAWLPAWLQWTAFDEVRLLCFGHHAVTVCWAVLHDM